MNQYRDDERGKFQTEFAKQLISYDGLLFRGRNGISNVSPTDVDGMVQLDNENCFIFFELKHSGDVPKGQATALTKLVDAVQAGGVNCIIIVAIHNTPHPHTVIAKDAYVSKVYFNGVWQTETKGRKLYEFALDYIKFIQAKDRRTQ